MEKEYEFIRIIERKNKEGKTYYLALVLYNRDNDSDLLHILVDEQTAEDLIGLDSFYDISDKVVIEYNSYQKKYEPKIKI